MLNPGAYQIGKPQRYHVNTSSTQELIRQATLSNSALHTTKKRNKIKFEK